MHGRQLCLRMITVCLQVYEFHDTHSGMLCIAQPPSGVPAASLLASALSWALGSPVRLPLEPLLTCSLESLPKPQRALYGNGTGSVPGKQGLMKLASPKCSQLCVPDLKAHENCGMHNLLLHALCGKLYAHVTPHNLSIWSAGRQQFSASYRLADGIEFTELERAGQLGSPVLPADLEMLQIRPLRPFAAGEICAFKEALTPAQAAAAAAHRRAGSAEGEA